VIALPSGMRRVHSDFAGITPGTIVGVDVAPFRVAWGPVLTVRASATDPRRGSVVVDIRHDPGPSGGLPCLHVGPLDLVETYRVPCPTPPAPPTRRHRWRPPVPTTHPRRTP